MPPAVRVTSPRTARRARNRLPLKVLMSFEPPPSSKQDGKARRSGKPLKGNQTCGSNSWSKPDTDGMEALLKKQHDIKAEIYTYANDWRHDHSDSHTLTFVFTGRAI